MRSGGIRVALALAAGLALACILPTQALADHAFLGAITSSPNNTIEDACGVAFDSEGDVYISDYFHDAIYVAGHPNITNENPTNGPCGLAVDSAGDVFVNNWRHEVVEFTPPTGGGSYSRAGAIDPGPANGVKFDPTTDRIYVDDGTYVAAYEPSGAPVEVGGKPLRIGEGTLEEGYGLAVSAYPETAGEIYVPDAATDTVKVYDPSLSLTDPVQVIDGSGTPQRGFAYLGESEAAVDPTDGHLYVVDDIGRGLPENSESSEGVFRASKNPEIVVDEFNAAGDYRGQIVAPPPVKTAPYPQDPYVVIHRMTEAEPSGIAIGRYVSTEGIVYKDAVYVSAGNSEGGAVWIFAPSPEPAQTLSVTKTGTGGGVVESKPAGIDCGSACTAEYDREQAITLFASPDPQSSFSGWNVEGPGDEPCPGTGTCTVTLFGNSQVRAEFEQAPLKALQVSISGQGTVGSEPAGISCPGHCSEEFAEGRTITLRARPAPHQRVASWTGCDSQPDADECRVTMSDARSIGVEFATIPRETLNVAVVGPGDVLSYPPGISCPGSCSAGFDEGSDAYLIATPEPGYLFDHWTGACSGTKPLCAVPIAGEESAEAEFKPEMPPAEPRPPGAAGRSVALPTPTISLRRLRIGAKRFDATVSATVSGAGHLSVLNGLLRHVEAQSRRRRGRWRSPSP